MLVLYLLVLTTLCIGTTHGVAEISNKTSLVFNLYEGTQYGTKLGCINCTSDTDFKVSRKSLEPSSTCGNCFDIFQENEDFCVFYMASQGSMDYSSADSYKLTAECVDGYGDSDTAVVDIRIRTNQIPTLELTSDVCSSDPFSKNTPAGSVIFNALNATDTNNDTLTYSMTMEPQSDIFDISVSDGTIRCKNILKMNCHPSITFHMSVQDTKNPSVGPKSITCNFDVYRSPTVSNINKDLEVPENTTVGSQLIKLTESPTSPKVVFDFSTEPENAYYLFEFVDDKLMLKYPLNYETTAMRSINMTILPQNRFCAPIPHYLHIIVTDCNDVPILTPAQRVLEQYEGKMTFSPNLTMIDEDENDEQYYSIISGDPKNRFTIDPSTGVISSIGEYDIDKNAMPSQVDLVIQVNDTKGHAVASSTVSLTILDANDNGPVFKDTSKSYTVMECSVLGGQLGSLTAEDNVDSGYNDNNVVLVERTGNGKILVIESGEIYLTGSIPSGQTRTLTVYAQDKGSFPKSQRSDIPATISVTSTACTTNAPNTGSGTGSGSGSGTGTGTVTGTGTGSGSSSGIQATTTSTTTTTTTVATTTLAIGTCEGFFCDTSTVLGMVFGALGALGLLASVGFCLKKYCKKSPEAKAKAKAKAEEKAKAKAEQKTKKEKAKRPASFDFWGNSVV